MGQFRYWSVWVSLQYMVSLVEPYSKTWTHRSRKYMFDGELIFGVNAVDVSGGLLHVVFVDFICLQSLPYIG